MTIFKSAKDSDGTSLGQDATDLVGLHGSKVVQATVTGARDETEGALANLLTALAAKGIIIDSTTVS